VATKVSEVWIVVTWEDALNQQLVIRGKFGNFGNQLPNDLNKPISFIINHQQV
jgi:hypothetical protein